MWRHYKHFFGKTSLLYTVTNCISRVTVFTMCPEDTKQNKTIFPKVTITVIFFKRKIFVSKCHCKDLFQKKKWEKIAKIKFLWLIPWKKVVYFYHLGILCWKHQAMPWFQYEYRSRDSQSHVRMTVGIHGFACWLLGYMGLLVYLIWSVRRLGYAF